MNIGKAILLLLLLQRAVPTAPQPQARPAASPGSIEGTVTGISGELLSSAKVTLVGPIEEIGKAPFAPQVTVTTGTDGKFVFENVRPGTHQLEASRTGYISSGYGQTAPYPYGSPVPLVMVAGQRMNDIRLSLTPTGVITGHILDSNGQPISRVLVQALTSFYSPQGRILDAAQSVTSNDMGEYRLYGLRPGTYYLKASTMDSQVTDAASVALNRELSRIITGRFIPGTPVNGRTLSDGSVQQEASVPVYYPGVFTFQDAMPIKVRPGAMLNGTDITVSMSRVQTVRGFTVNGNTGRRGPMMLQLIPKDDEMHILWLSRDSQRSSDNGDFEIDGVVPGSYWLMATDSPLRAVVSVDVGKNDVNNVELIATDGYTIKGQIRWDGPEPAGGNAFPIIQLSSSQLSAGDVVVNGVFELRGVFPGRYELNVLRQGGILLQGDILSTGNVSPPGEQFLKSASFDGQDVLQDGIRIDGPPNGTLDIVMSTAKGKLEGRVVNEKREGTRNAVVVVVPDPPFRKRVNAYFTPNPDASGKFAIEVPPGRYKVFAWQDVEPDAWLDPEFIRNYEGRGVPVTIDEGKRESVEVGVIPYTP